MQYRVLGRTGIRASEIGFGAWAIGGDQWGPQDDRESMAALHKALDLGCTLIDTAQVYGEGHSEVLIGRVLRERGERVTVATKVPPKNYRWGPPPGADLRDYFPADYIIKRCESSLRNLGTETLDLYQLHTWCPSWEHETEWYEALLKLRQQGKIRYIGISVSDHRPGEANPQIEAGRVDSIQVIYNILDQSPEWRLFPVAQKHHVGIIVRVPLASGALTGKFTQRTRFPKGDWRREWKDREWLHRMVEQVERIQFLTQDGMPLATAALKFVLSHPAVSTLIPGIRNSQQAEMNLSASDGRPLPEEHLRRLRQMYTLGLLGAETSAG
ncbi:MAG: aldo/keto reductase [Chloroflexi bacterium]|nr:aldo/keto reductase [Chloroflexota bacterium]